MMAPDGKGSRVDGSGQGRGRPVGWWLKTADRTLDDAFDAALAGTGADRRRWQVLASLAGGPVPRADVVASLAPFEPAEAIGPVVDDLGAQGLVAEDAGLLSLTAAGAARHAELVPLVGSVRERVAAALPPERYGLLLELLEELVVGLRRTP